MANRNSTEVTSKIKQVTIADLKIDYRYQRPLNDSRADTISGGWDPKLAGTISVSQRANGDEYVVDGQHRMFGADRNGRRTMRAEVFTGLTLAEEAEMFDRLNDARSRVDALTRFRARIMYGDPAAKSVEEIVNSLGATIQKAAGRREEETGVRAVEALTKIYNRTGREGLTWVLEVIRDAWDRIDQTTATARVLGGLEFVFINDRPSADEDRLVRRLNEEGLIALNRIAQTNAQIYGGYGAKNFYRAILEIYNKGLKVGSLNRLGGDIQRAA